MPRPRNVKQRPSRDIVSPLRDDQYDDINAALDKLHRVCADAGEKEREAERLLQESISELLRPARVAAGERCG